ncbi:MAG: hemerythrin domain-containing protein [Planctomycetota bacterium]|jgi:hemerythrin-like domain-containing protein
MTDTQEPNVNSSMKRTLDEHRELSQSLERFKSDLERFVAGEDGLREALRGDIEQLTKQLVTHFEQEESEAGLFEELLAATPRHASLLEELKAEHRAFLTDLYEVQAVLRGDDNRSLSDFAIFAVELISRLKAHESKENELLVEAAGGSQLGGGD